jgi:hypothetical protein
MLTPNCYQMSGIHTLLLHVNVMRFQLKQNRRQGEKIYKTRNNAKAFFRRPVFYSVPCGVIIITVFAVEHCILCQFEFVRVSIARICRKKHSCSVFYCEVGSFSLLQNIHFQSLTIGHKNVEHLTDS